jgi:glycosyltransferase involved in cell wall biosynthesis
LRLAISLTTYQRQDGKSPFYLRRSLDSVFAQEHQDFHLFVIGDHYENDAEFKEIVSAYPQKKMFVENLKNSVEREKYSNNKVLYWNCAGITAMNYASSKALEMGMNYICHLDHDDYWTPNHLSLINQAIERVQADWICTKSIYNSSHLPQNDQEGLFIPFLPFSTPIFAGVINSSTCYNYKTIPLKYRNAYEERGEIIPSDADLWQRVYKYCTENNLLGCLINEITCTHDEEGYLLNA